MARLHYAPLAEYDLIAIAEYTRKKWGTAQADKYMHELEDACKRLAAKPGLGRAHRGRRPGVLRLTQGSHVIFYETGMDGITVGRILHERMLPRKHGM